MRIVSIDIESTGLDPENNDILQIGAVIEDTKIKMPLDQLPKFNCFLWRPNFSGSAYAINLNNWIFDILAKYEARQRFLYQVERTNPTVGNSRPSLNNCSSFIAPWWQAPVLFYNWLKENQFSTTENSKRITINVAGKNFATFDKLFLEKMSDWSKLIKVRQRIIDPAILFVDWNEDDTLPNLDKCKQRAGLNDLVTHDAVNDALDIIRILRTRY